MAARETTFPVRVLAAALLAVAITATGVATASAESESAPAGPGREIAAGIATGDSHACALLDAATVKCWGANTVGQLGLGDTAARGDAAGEMGANLASVDFGPGRTGTAIAAGSSHTCALLDNATVKCWGANNVGQLGLGDTAARGDAAGEMGANLASLDFGPGRTGTAIAAGSSHTCALLDNATVKCWGYNGNGRLGLGDTARRGDKPNQMGANLPAVDLGVGRTATAITAGNDHTCALLDDATVKCWGRNLSGQLGQGDTADRGDNAGEMGATLASVDLGPGRTGTAIAAGSNHSCALLDDATVKCWGASNAGQLGQGDTVSRGDTTGEMGANLPIVDLGAGRTVAAITGGTLYTCAVLDDATVKCWGANLSGQLGQGDHRRRGNDPDEMGANLLPIDLGVGRTATAITTGFAHTCARLDDDSIKCWGDNVAGQLGQGDTTNRGNDPGEMGASLVPVDLGEVVNPPPTITPGLGLVAEGNNGQVVVNVAVTLSSPAAMPVTVDWTTLDVVSNPTIARSGLDYLAASGTVTFDPGETAEIVPITVLGDTIDEPPALYGEWGVVAFSNPTNATLDTSFFGLGIFIIIDDD